MDHEVLNELVDGLLGIMKPFLVRIVLYGSVARGSESEESDVDIALLVNGALDKIIEERLLDFVTDMNLKYDKVFSVIDINYDRFCQWENVLPFYQNINREGIVLWEREKNQSEE